jgi:hypothetical protein
MDDGEKDIHVHSSPFPRRCMANPKTSSEYSINMYEIGYIVNVTLY